VADPGTKVHGLNGTGRQSGIKMVENIMGYEGLMDYMDCASSDKDVDVHGASKQSRRKLRERELKWQF